MNDEITAGWRKAEREADLIVPLPDGTPMFFRLIPAGHIVMGARGERVEEEPRHQVSIKEPFYMATFPVTQRQWLALMGSTPAEMKARTDNGEGNTWGEVSALGDLQPMPFVNWYDAQAFITAFEAHTPAHSPSLPCEAQWEYACRAGTAMDYSSGDGAAALREVGWFDANSGGSTRPVGLLWENAFGLYDMYGNVWEWCEDVWDALAYAKHPQDWPARPWTLNDAGGDAEFEGNDKAHPLRVVRGGSFVGTARWCRAAFRYWWGPRYRIGFLGFRLCVSPGQVRTGSGATNRLERSQRLELEERGTSPETEGTGGADFASLKLPRRPA